jgi:hypothetical protein
MALDILLALSEHLADDVKLDRLVPYVISLLTDETALVRANALKTLTQVVSLSGFLPWYKLMRSPSQPEFVALHG